LPVIVPSFAVKWIQAASVGSGLPYNIVACQVNAESGFNARAVSSAGAEGPYQFLPSTFYSVWHGSPFSWQDSTIAYGIFMSRLLRQFHGNVRDALAAYNAGPGNIGAGLGYADGILACAGSGNISVGAGVGSPIGAFPSEVANVQPDDWSWYIYRTAKHIEDLSVTAYSWAPSIGRL
jgi:Transglycosylase SLT domain